MKPIVFIAALMHLIWGAALCFASADPLPTAAMKSGMLLGKSWAITLYLSAGLLALWSLPDKVPMNVVRCLLVLQQVMLLLSMWDASVCIYNSQFADSAAYPREFIIRDQPLYLLIGTIHLAYLFGIDPLAWTNKKTL